MGGVRLPSLSAVLHVAVALAMVLSATMLNGRTYAEEQASVPADPTLCLNVVKGPIRYGTPFKVDNGMPSVKRWYFPAEQDIYRFASVGGCGLDKYDGAQTAAIRMYNGTDENGLHQWGMPCSQSSDDLVPQAVTLTSGGLTRTIQAHKRTNYAGSAAYFIDGVLHQHHSWKQYYLGWLCMPHQEEYWHDGIWYNDILGSDQRLMTTASSYTLKSYGANVTHTRTLLVDDQPNGYRDGYGWTEASISIVEQLPAWATSTSPSTYVLSSPTTSTQVHYDLHRDGVRFATVYGAGSYFGNCPAGNTMVTHELNDGNVEVRQLLDNPGLTTWCVGEEAPPGHRSLTKGWFTNDHDSFLNHYNRPVTVKLTTDSPDYVALVQNLPGSQYTRGLVDLTIKHTGVVSDVPQNPALVQVVLDLLVENAAVGGVDEMLFYANAVLENPGPGVQSTLVIDGDDFESSQGVTLTQLEQVPTVLMRPLQVSIVFPKEAGYAMQFDGIAYHALTDRVSEEATASAQLVTQCRAALAEAFREQEDTMPVPPSGDGVCAAALGWVISTTSGKECDPLGQSAVKDCLDLQVANLQEAKAAVGGLVQQVRG